MMDMITTYEDFCLEKKSLENSDILFIVDVQSEFEKFIPINFTNKLNTYCKEFTSVYQIWDSNKTNKPTYKFPNQVDRIKKHFGIKKLYKDLDGGFDEWIKTIFDDKTANNIFKLIKNSEIKEGDRFKLKDKEEYLVYIDNAHEWFLVNSDMTKVFNSLMNKTIVIVGGADNECLEDVYVATKSFGLNPIYNHEYVYSADTNNTQITQN